MAGYISEFDLGGSNRFVEIAVPAGTDVSSYSLVIYNRSGNVIQTLSYDTAVATIAGSDVYVFDSAGDGLFDFQGGEEYAFALVDNVGTVERDKRPVLIKAGALGRNRPARDTIVSPQHRVMVGGRGQLEKYFPGEALVPAKALTALPGIRRMMGKNAITWIHFACAHHQVVRANGCWSESLWLGPLVVYGLRADERRILCRLFPDRVRAGGWNGAPARPCLSVGAARRRLRDSLGRAPPETDVQRQAVPWS